VRLSILVALVALQCVAAAQSSGPVLADILRFKYTFSNPDDGPVALTEIGVINKNKRPIGKPCKGYTRLNAPVADYIVRYDINKDGETRVQADPALVIEPHSAKTFQVSIMPLATGWCDENWITEVVLELIFSDGKKFQSRPQLISGSDVQRFQANTARDDEIITALKHKDPLLRIQGIEGLAKSTIDKDSAAILLEHKLQDPVKNVRMAAIQAVGDMGLNALVPQLLTLLSADTANDDSERYRETILVALAKVRDPRSIDGLLRALEGCGPWLNEIVCVPAYDGLVKMRNAAVPQSAKATLLRYFAKGPKHPKPDPDSDYKVAFPYYAHLSLVFEYRERMSPTLVSAILSKKDLNGLTSPLLHYMVAAYSRPNEVGTRDATEERIEDPAYVNNRALFYGLIHDPDAEIREKSLFLWLATGSDRQDADHEEEVVRTALTDSDSHVATTAAQWAGIEGFTKLSGDIQAKYRASSDLWERRMYCMALFRMGVVKNGSTEDRGNWETCN
jgi:HEAT repeats